MTDPVPRILNSEFYLSRPTFPETLFVVEYPLIVWELFALTYHVYWKLVKVLHGVPPSHRRADIQSNVLPRGRKLFRERVRPQLELYKLGLHSFSAFNVPYPEVCKVRP